MAEKNYPIEVFILFSSCRHGGWTRRLRNVDLRTDARSACKTAPVGTTCPTPRSKRLRRRAFLACAVVQPSTLRSQAALGSGFSLQAAFWYQNAMLARVVADCAASRRLFMLRIKKSSLIRFVAPPFQNANSSLVCILVFFFSCYISRYAGSKFDFCLL